MVPPGYDHGRLFRELFEHPDQWQQTRSQIDVLFSSDLSFQHKFSDQELQTWFAEMKSWNLRLGMEVGSVNPWGETGEQTFNIERPMWDRLQRLGANLYGIGMDEGLCCCRKNIHQPDSYAVEQVADYIARVRQAYPHLLVGDIEPYPFIPLEDQKTWIDALQKRLAELHVAGLDFYRLDVNWISFTVRGDGSWREVHKLELFCRRRKIPFSLIYWASGYPAMERNNLADDSTWYTMIMQQGYEYAAVGGRPDRAVIESWLSDAPSACVPDDQEFTFTRSVRDFCRKFVK